MVGYRLKMKRPISRNTHYYLTDEQAETIRQDSRVLAVELTPDQLGIKAGPMSFYNTSEYNIQEPLINQIQTMLLQQTGDSGDTYIPLEQLQESKRNVEFWSSN